MYQRQYIETHIISSLYSETLTHSETSHLMNISENRFEDQGSFMSIFSFFFVLC